jgi:hypothetical protein
MGEGQQREPGPDDHAGDGDHGLGMPAASQPCGNQLQGHDQPGVQGEQQAIGGGGETLPVHPQRQHGLGLEQHKIG